MATIQPTSELPASGGGSFVLYIWANMTTNDVGAPVELPTFADRTAQMEGTFNGATVDLKGSLDGTNYRSLTDPQGNAISKTAAALEAVTEIVRYIRPEVSGGTTPSVTVTVLMRVNP